MIVWTVMVTGVGPLPAEIVAGEKVAPAGKPVALKASTSGYVVPELRVNIKRRPSSKKQIIRRNGRIPT